MSDTESRKGAASLARVDVQGTAITIYSENDADSIFPTYMLEAKDGGFSWNNAANATVLKGLSQMPQCYPDPCVRY